MAQVILEADFGGRLLDSQPTNNLTDTVGAGEEDSSSNKQRGFLKFDLAAELELGATISGGVLRMFEYFEAASNARALRVYRCLRAMTSGATWNTYDGSNNWGTAGAANTTTDREATDIGSRLYSATEVLDEYKEITLNPAALQEMFEGPFVNNGFILVMDTENNDAHFHRPPGHASPPQLVIDYIPADRVGSMLQMMQ